jgi:methyltransferase
VNRVSIAILAYVTLERLFELWLARRNTARLMAQGATEYGASHYPLIVAIHVLWLLTLWVMAPWRTVDRFWLARYALLQIARAWVLGTLGPRWTTRIIILPGAPLVESGPYRFLNHPNYWVVIGEIAVLPLVFGLVWVALVFSILSALVLWVRIREENRALGRLQRG